MPEAMDELTSFRGQLEQICRTSVREMLWEDPAKASQPFWDALIFERRPPIDRRGRSPGAAAVPDEPPRPLVVFAAKPFVEKRATRTRSR